MNIWNWNAQNGKTTLAGYRLIAVLALAGIPFLLPSAGAPLRAQSDPGDDRPLRLLRSGADGIDIEFDAPDYSLSPLRVEDRDHLLLEARELVSTGTAGQPDLPVYSFLVGLPPQGELYLETETFDTQMRPLAQPLAPAASPIQDSGLEAERLAAGEDGRMARVIDPEAYARDVWSPETVARLVEIGWVRNQRVARIELRPFQYNPVASGLKVHGGGRLHIGFDPRPTEGPPAYIDDSFDAALQLALLNAESARDWRSEAGPEPETMPPPVSLPGTTLANIAVDTEGFYRVTGLDLTLAGIATAGLDPRRLQLFEAGQEVAISVSGASDGILDLSDAILFYGQASDSRYSAERIYRLVAGPAGGKRMASRIALPAGGRMPVTAGAVTRHFEQDAVYISERPSFQRGIPVPPENMVDRWYSARLTDTAPLVQTINDLNPAPGAAEAIFRIAVVGKSSFGTVTPDHQLRVRLNGQAIGEAFWDGDRSIEVFELPFDAALLGLGPLEVRIEAPGDTSASFDHFYVDWYQIDYRRRLNASGDVLSFRPDPGASAFDLGGFGGTGIQIYDVADPRAVVALDGVAVAGNSAPYMARFDESRPQARYFALESGQLRAPRTIRPRPAQGLTAPPGGADYLIISHASFIPALQPLVNARAGKMRVALFDVQDVYDAFSGGMVSAEAIRDLVSYAYHHWAGPRLQHVLLVGDGSYDLRKRLAGSNSTYIPPYLALADPWLGEIASDNAYVTVNGVDYFPDLNISRLPVKSAAETSRVVSRILAYEGSAPTGAWRSRMLFVTDDADVADFYALSNTIADGHTPADIQKTKIYYKQTHASASEARNAVIAAINSGQMLTQYIGHGQPEGWAAESLLRRTDLTALTNGDRLTVMLDWTCLTGSFHEATGMSMAEAALLAPSGGAVAYFAPTGFGVATGHDFMNRSFFSALLRDGTTQLGALAMASKLYLFTQTGAYHDLLESYMLFGDSAMNIQLPPGFVATGPTSTATVLPVPSVTPIPPSATTTRSSPTATVPSATATARTATATVVGNTPTVPGNTATATATAAATRTSTATSGIPTATATSSATATAPSATPSRTATATLTPTRTATPVPPTLTSTPVPPTLTSTPVPPTLTATPVPPTLTATPVPPTLTATPVQRTATSTAPPPSATATVNPSATTKPSATPTGSTTPVATEGTPSGTGTPGTPGTPGTLTPGTPGTPGTLTPGTPGTPGTLTPGTPGTLTPGTPGTLTPGTPGTITPGLTPGTPATVSPTPATAEPTPTLPIGTLIVPSVTPTGPSPTPSATPTGPSPTPSATPTGPSPTPSATPTGPSPTPSVTPTGPSPTPSATPTLGKDATPQFLTPTPSPSPTFEPTETATATEAPDATITPEATDRPGGFRVYLPIMEQRRQRVRPTATVAPADPSTIHLPLVIRRR